MIAALALLALPMAAQAVTTHTIVVGGPGILAFNPPSINAEVGDIMHFVFHQKNHTVTQSSFASPCTPFTDPTTNEAGFNSGLYVSSSLLSPFKLTRHPPTASPSPTP